MNTHATPERSDLSYSAAPAASFNYAAAGNGAMTLLFQIEGLGRAVPEPIR